LKTNESQKYVPVTIFIVVMENTKLSILSDTNTVATQLSRIQQTNEPNKFDEALQKSSPVECIRIIDNKSLSFLKMDTSIFKLWNSTIDQLNKTGHKNKSTNHVINKSLEL
jgi:hypothetical protein